MGLWYCPGCGVRLKWRMYRDESGYRDGFESDKCAHCGFECSSIDLLAISEPKSPRRPKAPWSRFGCPDHCDEMLGPEYHDDGCRYKGPLPAGGGA